MEAKHTPKYTLFSSGLMSSVLFHYSCILLSYGYMTGFMSLCFTLVLCFVITYLVWLTGALMASDVGIYSGSCVGGSGHETSCNLTTRVILLGLGTRPAVLLSHL